MRECPRMTQTSLRKNAESLYPRITEAIQRIAELRSRSEELAICLLSMHFSFQFVGLNFSRKQELRRLGPLNNLAGIRRRDMQPLKIPARAIRPSQEAMKALILARESSAPTLSRSEQPCRAARN